MSSKSLKAEQSSKSGDARFKFVAMPINHFGEKVRWCMDIINVPYEPEQLAEYYSGFFRGSIYNGL